MATDRLKILDQEDIFARLQRMAFEIYEQHYLEKQVIILGIEERGSFLAEEIANYLSEISELEITLAEVHVDRPENASILGIDLSLDIEELEEQVVIVINDVLHTGLTLLNVAAILLHAGPRCIQTGVLINRGHRAMPVSSDYVGLELATTIHQHVSVEINPAARTAAVFLE